MDTVIARAMTAYWPRH